MGHSWTLPFYGYIQTIHAGFIQRDLPCAKSALCSNLIARAMVAAMTRPLRIRMIC